MNAPALPLIDVFLIHWQAPEWCVRAAASLLNSKDVEIRCHVVDNGETGGDSLARALDPRVDILRTSENLGYAGGANIALARAMTERRRADFIVIASHDLLVRPDTFAELCAVARADPKIGVVGPVLTAPAENAGGTWRGWRAQATSSWDPDMPFEDREWMSGNLLLIRPECVAEIGGFDAALGSYVEDVDFCLRARDLGWGVGVATRARASGIGSTSSSVTVMVDVNSVLVAVKRGGVRVAFPILARYVFWAVRGFAASALPGRDRARRHASLIHARDHVHAIGRLASNWCRVRQIARDPDAAVPRFERPHP